MQRFEEAGIAASSVAALLVCPLVLLLQTLQGTDVDANALPRGPLSTALSAGVYSMWLGSAILNTVGLRRAMRPRSGSRAWRLPALALAVLTIPVGWLHSWDTLVVLAHYCSASLALLLASSVLRGTIVCGSVGLCYALLLYLEVGLDAAVGMFLAAFLLVCAGAIVGVALSKWRRELAFYDQARWAAARFSAVNLRLQDDLGRVEVWTRGKERDRVAREIHDIVGHTLTSILVQTHAAREMLAS